MLFVICVMCVSREKKKKATAELACVAAVQRGGKGEVEFEREARSLGSRRERDPYQIPVPYEMPTVALRARI